MNSFLQPLNSDELKKLKKPELIELLIAKQDLLSKVENQLSAQLELNEELKDGFCNISGILVKFKQKLFGRSSEKSKTKCSDKNNPRKKSKPNKNRKKSRKLPSERYPNAPIVEKQIEFAEIPCCSNCGAQMCDSGMSEQSEYLDVIPQKFVIVRQIRHKYRCKNCHSEIKTAPSTQRIRPGSSYSDEMIVDVALSKYCDLIPTERYCAMASRMGFDGLPPHSLITATHDLAELLAVVVNKIKDEVQSCRVLKADETPHRMLEGSHKSNWFLWSFASETACYFSCHDTRSGRVALEFLSESNCEVFLSDDYAGYNKAVAQANEKRQAQGQQLIAKTYCNAHSRRKFKECELEDGSNPAQFFIDQYQKIYQLERLCKDKPLDQKKAIRCKMTPYFESMKKKAQSLQSSYSSKSNIGKAIAYFLKNYEGLIYFINDPEALIDEYKLKSLSISEDLGLVN